MQLSLGKDDVSILSELGLTGNQIKVYLSLLKISRPARAIEIFKNSSVPRQDIYRVLLELQQMGIVEKLIVKPTEFVAVHPRKAVLILIQNKKEYFSELKIKAEVFSKNVGKRYCKTQLVQDRERFVLITERRAIINAIKENIEKTSRVFFSIAPRREFLSCLTILLESLSSIKRRGTKVKWITQMPGTEELPRIFDILKENQHIEVRCIRETPSVKFALSDGKEIVLAVYEEGDFAETPALCTNSPAVISLAQNYFVTCWKHGKDLNASNVISNCS
jgi:sugar-specific transcriptional regulator TrmB